MLRLVLAMAATVSAVVFVMANTHHVKISFAFGSPVKVRLIFLLMITFFAGAIVSGFFAMISKLRLRWHVSQRIRRETKASEPEQDMDDGDLVAE